MSQHFATASVHGRFQPLHLEHLDYILSGFERAEFVYIGITQYQRSHLKSVEGADPHRNESLSNPLTYFERSELVTRALDAAGVDRSRYRVTPFPIEYPEQLTEYLPLDVPILTTRVDEWNDRKIELLQRVGYEVIVLYNREPKGISGSEIRTLMVENNDRWTQMVPGATVEYLRSLELAARMIPSS